MRDGELSGVGNSSEIADKKMGRFETWDEPSAETEHHRMSFFLSTHVMMKTKTDKFQVS